MALALVLAQALGVLHRIEHGPSRAAPPTAWQSVGAVSDAHVDAHGRQSQAGQNDDRGSHGHEHDVHSGADVDGDHDCAAFDHATVADAATIPLASLPGAAAPEAGVASAEVASPIAAQAAGYLARGPPAA